MNLKEELQNLINSQEAYQKLRKESIPFKKTEAERYLKSANNCKERITEIEQEIKVNEVYIEKLQKILDQL
jgi:thymidylate kinase